MAAQLLMMREKVVMWSSEEPKEEFHHSLKKVLGNETAPLQYGLFWEPRADVLTLKAGLNIRNMLYIKFVRKFL